MIPLCVTMLDRFQITPAVYLLLFRGEQVLLLLRQNTGYEDGNYSVPAGHHDGGQSLTSAAVRELQEETGLIVTADDLHFGTVMHRVKQSGEERVDFFFVVDRWQGEPKNLEPEKCGDLRFLPVSELPTNTIPFVVEGIQAVLAGRPYVECGW